MAKKNKRYSASESILGQSPLSSEEGDKALGSFVQDIIPEQEDHILPDGVSPYDAESYDSGRTDEYDRFYDEQPAGAPEKFINAMTVALTVLLLGGSIVFWWVVLRYLLVSPYSLADPAQMMAMLICCGCLPAIIAIGQGLLRKPVSAERWLLCMCLSGALTTAFIFFLQAVVRKTGISAAQLPTLLCCAVSGCALPSMLVYAARMLLARARKRAEQSRNVSWETVRADVLALTDFEYLR